MRQLHAAVLALLAATGGTMAQEAGTLSNLSSCRLNAELISLTYTYQAGACEDTGDPGVEMGEAGTAIVVVPVVVSNDVCKAQATDVQSTSAVAVPDAVTSLTVRMVTPDGEVKATGTTDITPNSPDCVPPKPTQQDEASGN